MERMFVADKHPFTAHIGTTAMCIVCNSSLATWELIVLHLTKKNQFFFTFSLFIFKKTSFKRSVIHEVGFEPTNCTHVQNTPIGIFLRPLGYSCYFIFNASHHILM